MKKKEEEFGMGVGFKDYTNNVEEQQGQDFNSFTSMTTTTNWKDKNGTRSRPSVPYHIPNIPRPQDEFQIFVDNRNQPFEHPWLLRSADGSRVIHPLENLSQSDFIDKDVGSIEPVKPLPMEHTPFKLVKEVKELKQLAATLHSVNEFAVDLEHNQYRSFQGMTCLMQISTRIEDFVVDTLKLRVHVGPYLREVFKDPSKKKVMHGADRDIVWLQRDFGIYICNLFDTQQASRVLDLERNSLEYLLLYFCGVTVNKAYQNADWRQRPLPEDMLKYAREDTHYLLYIYDLMRHRLFSRSMGAEGGNDLLLEVYRRSYDVCMQLYEKELLTDTSYLYIYGLQEADFNSQQLSIVSGLCEWRDAVARAEDESTGFILPNKTLLEIARQIPLTVGKLRRLVKSKHPYVEVNLDSIVDIIKNSIKNAAAFESTAHLLKTRRQETISEATEEMLDKPGHSIRSGNSASNFDFNNTNPEVAEKNVEGVSVVDSQQERIVEGEGGSRVNVQPMKEEHMKAVRGIFEYSISQESSFQPSGEVEEIKKQQDGHNLDLRHESFTISGQMRHSSYEEISDSTKVLSGKTEELLNIPRHECGSGTSTLKSKFDTASKVKVDQIKSLDISPLQSFVDNNEQLKPLTINDNGEVKSDKESIGMLSGVNKLELTASSGSCLADLERLPSFPTTIHNGFERREDADTEESNFELKEESEDDTKQLERAQEVECGSQLRASNCSAAKKHMRWRRGQEEMLKEGDEGFKGLLNSREEHNSSIISRFRKDELTRDFQQGKHYQVFLQP